MANEIKLTFAGDATQLTKSFDKVGAGAKEMAADIDTASSKSERAVGALNSTIGASESKFMGAADLADGLATTLGLNVGPTIELARGFGDMAGGFDTLVGPALEKMTGKFKNLSVVTKAQTIATTALNTVMRANPILLAVTAVAALTAGFIIAYKKSETFRAIVQGAMAGVRTAIDYVGDKVTWLSGKIAGAATDAARTFAKIADIITTPYQLAFRAVASLWNNTVGRLEVSLPGFSIPGVGGWGGISFGVPDIPMLASGGIARAGRPHIVGERGPELFVPGMTGTVIPNGAGQQITVVFAPGDPLWEALKKNIRVKGGIGPNSVQLALGS